jgi:ABC-2 type transport system ATP-binding protein
MRTIAGLQSPDAGTIEIAEVALPNAADRKRACTLTPQDVALFEYLTCVETLRMVASVHGVPSAEADQRIEHWLEVTGLTTARGRMVKELSVGMKRKLAVACALLPEPAVVLLDESFTGLDPESTRALQNALRAFCDRGGAVLLSSHILDMVQSIADRVIFMVNGRVVESLDREQLHALIPESYSDLTDIYLARVRDATEVA